MSLVRTLLSCGALALALVNPRVDAAESYDNCTGTITSLPATISTQGVWCLKADLATAISSGAAILIATNNVTIDCNDFKIGGLAAGPATQAVGIRALDRQNAIVRRCNIRGFYFGLETVDGGGHLIEDNRFVANTLVGLRVASAGSTVRQNFVVDTGGSDTVNDFSFGMVVANGVDVLDNTIAGLIPPANGAYVRGIQASGNDYATISRNRISGLVRGVGGIATSLMALTSYRIIVEGNFFFGSPENNDVGLSCESNTSSSIRNAFVAIETPVAGCLSSGDVVNAN